MLSLDTDHARRDFIDARRAVLDQAENVAAGRERGTLSAAALDRLVVDVDTYQTARRRFILLVPQ